MSGELAELIPDGVTFKAAITSIEGELRQMPQIPMETIHHFSPGVYARELRIPSGTILTGKIHKTEHLCIMQGDMDIADESGFSRITGYHVFKSKPGVKRIGRTYSDTIFTTIHATELTDIEDIEENLVVDTYEDYEAFRIESIKNIGITS